MEMPFRARSLPRRDDYPLHDMQRTVFDRFARGFVYEPFKEHVPSGSYKLPALVSRIFSEHNAGLVRIEHPRDDLYARICIEVPIIAHLHATHLVIAATRKTLDLRTPPNTEHYYLLESAGTPLEEALEKRINESRHTFDIPLVNWH